MAFLASDDASFITKAVLPVDGGYMARWAFLAGGAMVFRLCVAAVACGLGSGCLGYATLADDPLLVILKQQSAWNAGNLVGFMAGYRRDETTSFLSTDGLVSGWGTVLERYRRRYPDAAAMGKLTFSELKVHPVTSDVIVVTGRYALERQGDAPAGIFSLVLKHFSEGWRIVHDHTSAFPPPPGAAGTARNS